ncbi:hypothetical protein AB0454_22665 [Streptomyces sp. NPDC093509]|uniref:hypothetical protein n=1 Tax=Streptomyces sp. NPDC093509 TaxID=3154982 RepID=UPI00344B5484
MTRTKNRATRRNQPANTTPAAPRQKATPAPKAPAQPAISLVKLTKTPKRRRPLTKRPRTLHGRHTGIQLVEARACLASATARLPIPHILWLAQPNGQAAARLTDGTFLLHTAERAPDFLALIRCPLGTLHAHTIHTAADLAEARAVTHACMRQHETDDHHKAITHGVRPTAKPKPSAVLALREGVRRAEATKADTQPLSRKDIADGLAARADGTDTAKEHPEP